MKKEYVLLVLFLAGFSVVNTMAFSVDSDIADDVALWELEASAAQVDVVDVVINAYGYGHVSIEIWLDATAATDDITMDVIFLGAADAELDLADFDTAGAVKWARDDGSLSSEVTPIDSGDEILQFTVANIATDSTDYITIDIVDALVTTTIEKVFVSIKDDTGTPSSDSVAHVST
ncbi:hypothetical protein HN807_11880 [Candidatus Bathyarchaeota archaeon]|jgi:hypothetical protein|nr:hypothetical protein [Candidatus Bathyarchaeota archaeon]MBT7347770.1 hypothetical protein [Candidatus Bathyarchaeota archaeon]